MPGPRLPRRGALAVLAATAAAPVVAGCSPGARGVAATAAPTGPPPTVMIVRHAEKPAGDVGGVDENGAPDPESLTTRGWSRAGALVGLVAPSVGAPRAGLVRPTSLLAPDPGSGGSRRPLETLGPVAAVLGVPVSSTVHKSDHAGAAAAIRAAHGALLVAWQHEDIPGIVAALGTVSPAPPRTWPGDRYDLVWTLVPVAGGWRFGQVAQLLLAGDSPQVIG